MLPCHEVSEGSYATSSIVFETQIVLSNHPEDHPMTALAILIGLFVAALMLRNLAALCYTQSNQYKYEQRLKRYL
jgi:hypothetical protein